MNYGEITACIQIYFCKFATNKEVFPFNGNSVSACVTVGSVDSKADVHLCHDPRKDCETTASWHDDGCRQGLSGYDGLGQHTTHPLKTHTNGRFVKAHQPVAV